MGKPTAKPAKVNSDGVAAGERAAAATATTPLVCACERVKGGQLYSQPSANYNQFMNLFS